MERYIWSTLTPQQKGRYAEYYVKMEFTLFGFDVYSPEIDDKGIDFVVRKGRNPFKEIQVKSSQNLSYVFMRKDKFKLSTDLLLALVLFYDGKMPQLYLLPSTLWLSPNSLFVSRDYEGKASKPEWGLNLTGKTIPLLEAYIFEQEVQNL